MRRLCKSKLPEASGVRIVTLSIVVLCSSFLSAPSVSAAEPTDADLTRMGLAALEGPKLFIWTGGKPVEVDPKIPLRLGDYYVSLPHNTACVVFLATSVRRAEVDIDYIGKRKRVSNRKNVSLKGPDMGDGGSDGLSTVVYQIPPGEHALVKVTCRVRDSDLSGFVPRHQAVRIVFSDPIRQPDAPR